MTVSNPSNKQIYAGDGTTTSFPITFQLPAGSTGSDVKVVVVDASGNETVLTTNYTVDPNGLTVTYPVVGGVAPLAPGVNALPTGWEIVLLRVEPLTQLLNLLTQGSFSSAAVMGALDLIVMSLSQLQEQLNRAVLLPLHTPDNQLSPVIAPQSGILITYQDTYANLKAKAAAAPTVQFWGFATDQFQLYFYCANTAVGDQGFILAP